MASPISATIELSRCWTTERVMGSTDADMSVGCAQSFFFADFFAGVFFAGLMAAASSAALAIARL